MSIIQIDVAKLKQAISLSKITGKDQYQLALFISNYVFGSIYDRGGVDYVQHCIRVSMNPRLKGNIIAQCIALLHDVVEDSTLTNDDLISCGVTVFIARGVGYMTHPDTMTYDEYIDVMIADLLKFHLTDIQAFIIVEAALLVKLSDMEDNSRLDRLVVYEADEKSIKRITKYIINYKKILKAFNHVNSSISPEGDQTVS